MGGLNKAEGGLKTLDFRPKKIVRTRNQILRSTSSCRVWQFKYCIINYYFKKYNSSFLTNSKLIDEICIIITSFLSSNPNTDNVLHKTIFLNIPINIRQINSIEELDNNRSKIQNYYMCIYNPYIQIGSILHFFTIKHAIHQGNLLR